MYSQWTACLWIVLLFGAFAESASVPGALRKRNILKKWGNGLYNWAHMEGYVLDPTCADQVDFPCMPMLALAEKCDQPIATKLIWYNLANFGNCYRFHYLRAAQKAKNPGKFGEEYKGCDNNWKVLSLNPQLVYQNPKEPDTKRYYADNGWLPERKDCSKALPVAQGKQAP